MTGPELQDLLDRVRRGDLDPSAAAALVLTALRAAPFEDLGFARVDTHRALRQGFPEVILGIGKTPAQIESILKSTARPFPVAPSGSMPIGAGIANAKGAVDAVNGPVGPVLLTNNIAKTGLSAAKGSYLEFFLPIPADTGPNARLRSITPCSP